MKGELTGESVELILSEMIESGINPVLRKYATNVGIFFDFLGKHPNFMNIYLANQQTRAELLADEIVDISDNEDMIERAKIKISARQWYASKVLYRKYGDKLAVDHTHTVDVKGALEDALARASQVIDVSPARKMIAPVELEVEEDPPEYDRAKDEKKTKQFVKEYPESPRAGEGLLEWGERIVGDLSVPKKQDIDIFS